jgi:hypothetical protein
VEDRGRQVVFEFKPENSEKVGKRHSRIHSKGRPKLARRFKVGAAAILLFRIDSFDKTFFLKFNGLFQ